MMGLGGPEIDPRARMVELARSYVGETAEDPRGRYRELVAPAEKDFAVAAMLRMSGCALVVRGLWRLLGVEHPILARPYVIGMAIADVLEIARAKGAWVYPGAYGSRFPGLGDVVLVGGGEDGGGVEHVYVVTSEVEDGGNHVTLTSVDGGQRTKTGHQTIAARGRVWRPRGGRAWDTAIDDGVEGTATRVVVGWADVERLLAG